MSQKVEPEPIMSLGSVKNPQGEEVPVMPGEDEVLVGQDGPIDRNTIIRRAKRWVDQRVPYSQSAYKDGYRTDCSGYVSMAWNLSSSKTTWTLPDVSRRITKEDLQPGDVLIKNNPADPVNGSHVVIFLGWVDHHTHTAYRAYEQTPPYSRYTPACLSPILAMIPATSRTATTTSSRLRSHVESP